VRERLAAALLAVTLISLPGVTVAKDDEPFSLASLGLKGTAVYKNFSHFDTTRDDPQLIRNEGLIRLEFTRRLAPWLETRPWARSRRTTTTSPTASPSRSRTRTRGAACSI
jgi:hypothetical protein